VKLPVEIFYYGGNCGDEATMAEIMANFQNIIETKLSPLFTIVCPSGETCLVEDIVVTF
jgi:hypothetical protein